MSTRVTVQPLDVISNTVSEYILSLDRINMHFFKNHIYFSDISISIRQRVYDFRAIRGISIHTEELQQIFFKQLHFLFALKYYFLSQ